MAKSDASMVEKEPLPAEQREAIRSLVYKSLTLIGVPGALIVAAITAAISWSANNIATNAYEAKFRDLLASSQTDAADIKVALGEVQTMLADRPHLIYKPGIPVDLPNPLKNNVKQDNSVAECPNGLNVVGGGFVDESGELRVVHSHPDGTSRWIVRAVLVDQPGTFQAFAVCSNLPAQ